MVFPVIGGDGKPTGYEISNSLRVEADDSPKLSKTVSTATNTTNMTFSLWYKLGELATMGFISKFADSNNRFHLRIMDDGSLLAYNNVSGTYHYKTTTAKLRDLSAWYHIVFAYDTTDSTAADRLKIYLNGTRLTSFVNNTNPSSNEALKIASDTSNPIKLLCSNDEDAYLSGYVSDLYYIDGQTKAPTDFGETNDNGVWIPKKYLGTFGNNGFKMEFQQTGTSANSSGIGADTSGNDHHLTVANLAATDVTTDTPTNNFATLVPALNIALSEGNTKVVTTRTSNWDGVHSSIGVTSGKWYFELKASLSDDSFRIAGGFAGNPETFPKIFNGLGDNGDPLNTFSNTYPFYGKGVWLSHWYDQNYDDSSTASAQSSGDILQFALDMDNYKLWVGVNGQFKDNSNNNVSYSDVASGNSPTVTIASAAYTGKTFFPGILIRDDQDADDNVAEINFGNPSFSISSGNTDGLYGNFEYAVPSGYYALCTKRLATYG